MIAGHVVNDHGCAVDADLDRHTLSVPLGAISRSRLMMVCTADPRKADVLRVAMTAGLVNAVVLDAKTARAALWGSESPSDSGIGGGWEFTTVDAT
jgi:DNA-binding transcriptional regulator LsrR (DeoR family)